jgi:hypothetical protein
MFILCIIFILAPPINFRTWKLPTDEKSNNSKKTSYKFTPTALSKQILYVETFFIIKIFYSKKDEIC